MKKKVALIKTEKCFYPNSQHVFRPSVNYPEYLWKADISPIENHIYEMVRCGFVYMGLDKENYDTSEWNPLGEFVKSGDTVLLKPNMVLHQNHIIENGVDCLYTNPAVVAAVVDYIVIALKGSGEIVIGDAPMQECDFDRLIKESGYDNLLEYYKEKLCDIGISIRIEDFRGLKSYRVDGLNYSEEVPISGTIIDLGNESEFYGSDKALYDNLRITNYDPALLKQHHNRLKNEYYINDSVLKADVIINMPKPKTHRKAGVTISLKNFVGISCRKEYLPHHTNGSKEEGGDEYLHKSSLKTVLDNICDKRNYYMQTKKAYRISKVLNTLLRVVNAVVRITDKDRYYEGNWYGNDTISKTIVDLNKIVLYADKSGNLTDTVQRKVFIVADMIISGEKEGPVAPSPKDVGIIAMGDDLVCFDECIMTLMGAKKEFNNTLSRAKNIKGKLQIYNPDDCAFLCSNYECWNNKRLEELTEKDILYFEPSLGWTEAFYGQHE